MYIQVTTRCNLKCKHCKFSCSPSKGKDMPLDIFREAVDIAMMYDSGVTFGGGEPTLHPDIVFMLGYATLMSPGDYAVPFMITNGVVEEDTWKVIARAHMNNRMTVRVSRDPWHDEGKIKPWVWEFAEEHKLWWGNTGRRTIEKMGRARRHVDELEQEAHDYGMYDQVEVTGPQECGPRVASDGYVWADVPRKLGGGRIGKLSEETYGKALDVLREAEEQGVRANPRHKH